MFTVTPGILENPLSCFFSSLIFLLISKFIYTKKPSPFYMVSMCMRLIFSFNRQDFNFCCYYHDIKFVFVSIEMSVYSVLFPGNIEGSQDNKWEKKPVS